MVPGVRKDPLGRPAAIIIRDRALRLVRDADKAVARFDAKGDARALHQVRLALRRLRGWLRAFDSQLQMKSRLRRRLQRLARATNIARDAGIACELLDELQPELESAAKTQVMSLALSLGVLREKHYRLARRELPSAWRKLSAKLRYHIAAIEPAEDSPRFRQAFAHSLRIYIEGFEAALRGANRNPDAPHIHRLRIAGKRIRYLTETILPWYPQAKPLVRELTALHADAGHIQDLQRFMELSEEVFLHQAAARYRRLLGRYTDIGAHDRRLPKPGSNLTLPLLSICRTVAKQQARYMAAVKKSYLARRRPDCVSRMHKLADQLDKRVTNR